MKKVLYTTTILLALAFAMPVSAASENILVEIKNITVERDGEEVKRPIPIKDFFEMAMANVRALEEKVRSLGLTPLNSITVDNSLSLGSSGGEVRDLQILLNASEETRLAETGPGSPGNETNFYGPLTQEAVRKFQEMRGIGVTGIVDEATREALNSIYLR